MENNQDPIKPNVWQPLDFGKADAALWDKLFPNRVKTEDIDYEVVIPKMIENDKLD